MNRYTLRDAARILGRPYSWVYRNTLRLRRERCEYGGQPLVLTDDDLAALRALPRDGRRGPRAMTDGVAAGRFRSHHDGARGG